MLASFITSYRLKNTYRVNSIVYALKHTPLIKKLFSYSLYSNSGLKTLMNIISTIIEFFTIFIGKLLYILICVFVISKMYNKPSLAFINIITFLTIIGAFLNTQMFNPSVDKFYAINLMRFDAKKYIISNYLYFLLKCLIGLYPFVFIFGLQCKVSIEICLLIPLFVVSIKNITNAWSLKGYNKKQKVHNENKLVPYVIILVAVFLLCAYGLPYFNLGINNLLFYILFLITFIIGIVSFIYILKYENYLKVSKDLLKKDEILDVKNNNSNIDYKKQINNDIVVESNKVGYAYLNDIFVQRHKKLLTKASKKISIILLLVFIVLIAICIFFNGKTDEFNDLLKKSLPYYLFIMYFINRGQQICQTMFMNCDHGMLTYRFYRQPKAILSLFKERLMTLIKLNIIPGLIMAFGTDILLYVTGGATSLEYIMTLFTIISMSIFFSIHYLVLYYLLQPYDINLEIKNPAFMTICSFTYFICYCATRIQIPTTIFGLIMCIFTLLYSAISLYLAYKYAPKNFKLRMN